MSRDRPVIEATSFPSGEFPSRTRSAVTNHKDLLPGLDGRSATARRFRDLVNAFVADMGGLDHCSEIKLGLVRRLAAATVQAEMLEARMMNGEAIDIATLCTLASGQASNGLSGSPGFVRAGKTDPPSLTALALGAPLHAQAGTK